MKTSIEIPDSMVREVRMLAAREGKKLKEIVEESLRQTLETRAGKRAGSVADIEPVSVGTVLPFDEDSDLLAEMIDARGHRY
jgi:predicted transcriptional regulator